MKSLLKALAMIVGIIVLLSILLKMIQKNARTAIRYDGIDRIKNTATISADINGKNAINIDVPLTAASREVYTINDFKLEVTQLGNIISFKVLDDKGNEMAVKLTEKSRNESFVIYSE